MARRRISQREARLAIERVRVLEDQESVRRRAWSRDWPGGVHLGDVTWTDSAMICEAAITARKLGHAVVVVPEDNRKRLAFFALPLTTKG